MSLPFDAGRSLAPLDQDRTLIVVVDMSQSSWLVSAIVPRVERHPLKKASEVLPSTAGYYLGTRDHDGMPNSQESETREDASAALTAHMDAAADVCRENRVEAKKSCAALGNSSDTALGIYECSFGIMHSIYDINT